MKDIVLVDDDDDVREMMAEVLREEGFSVYEAQNGLAALEQLEARDWKCLLVVDVMMPVMDGSDLLRTLAQSDRLSTMRVVVLSAGDVVHQVQLADAFLSKPVLPEELVRCVRQFCDPSEGDQRVWPA